MDGLRTITRRSPVSFMVSWTIRTARSLSSAGCWCPDPCFGVCCFGADMGYILPKNEASIKPRAVHRLARGGHREVTDFLGTSGGSPVQVDFEPSIELAHG